MKLLFELGVLPGFLHVAETLNNWEIPGSDKNPEAVAM